jgi:hypothetical protein
LQGPLSGPFSRLALQQGAFGRCGPLRGTTTAFVAPSRNTPTCIRAAFPRVQAQAAHAEVARGLLLYFFQRAINQTEDRALLEKAPVFIELASSIGSALPEKT